MGGQRCFSLGVPCSSNRQTRVPARADNKDIIEAGCLPSKAKQGTRRDLPRRCSLPAFPTESSATTGSWVKAGLLTNPSWASCCNFRAVSPSPGQGKQQQHLLPQPQSSRQSVWFPETELQWHPPAEMLAGPQIPLPSRFPLSPANQRPENEQGLLSILAGQTSLFTGHIN